MGLTVEKIISGGQTGVDRAALDAGRELGIETGGHCPKGRKAEDGCIPPQYLLTETKTASYPPRTKLNVKNSDGTLILNVGRYGGGTALTEKYAREYGKPFLLIQLDEEKNPAGKLVEWLSVNQVQVLNVAGPRESKRPGIHAQALQFLKAALSSD